MTASAVKKEEKAMVARAFGIIAVAAKSAGDTVTEGEALSIIEGQISVIREIRGAR